MFLVRILFNSFLALATLGAFLSLGSLFSKHHLWFDLISHFRVQYIALLSPAFLIATYAKKTIPVLVISIALAVHGYAVAMSLLPISTNNDTDYAELTVLNSNLLLVNTNYQAQLDIIEAKNPDLITFQEYTPDWHKQMSSKLTNYPHRLTEPTGDSFGIAIYSKHPISPGSVDVFSTETFPALSADVKIEDLTLHVIVVHPPPPSRNKLYLYRNKYMETIAMKTKGLDNAALVIGDFNSTPWTAHFTDMLSVGKLRNARAGFGFHPTWPTPIFALQIPIDHILVNAKIDVDHFESIHLEGSDHRNVLGRLRVY